MSREVRRVPAGWEHPRDAKGRFVPLFGRDYATRAREWDEGAAKWAAGLRSDFNGGWTPRTQDELGMSYAKWDGERPVPEDYMPAWPEAERTHLMMYESTSEGTPLSPAFETPEELARWCADHGASAFGSQTASYEAWLRVARGGATCSAVVVPGVGILSGVEALAKS